MLVRSSALKALADTGWRATVEAAREVRAGPTPESRLIPGIRIDALPVAETCLAWCVVRAR
jgi:hypothetical protein